MDICLDPCTRTGRVTRTYDKYQPSTYFFSGVIRYIRFLDVSSSHVFDLFFETSPEFRIFRHYIYIFFFKDETKDGR